MIIRPKTKETKRKRTKKNYVHLDVAKSHHGRCFVCGKKHTYGNRLKVINKESLGYAYSEHKLILKSHGRACSSHLDANRNIKKKEYLDNDFETEKKPVLRETQLMYESIKVYNENNGIFDKFKDMAFLDEEHCIKITGWDKQVFADFVSYLTDINSTDTRTKEEIIAIYRYWLRNGMSQTCISLYKKETGQQTISSYLELARLSIYKYFVPFFLGCNRDRSFYLNHRTETSKILYDLTENDLCFIADGSYLNCQKSRNHVFQYDSYSKHKGTNLIKPMIVCCPDGYIVDCYGPFPARDNDASIMRDIIDGDEKFRALVTEHEGTSFVLDRGKIISKNFKKYLFHLK